MVVVNVASLDMADKAPGFLGSRVEENGVIGDGSKKFKAIVRMSQWVTDNTCTSLGSGSMEYELVVSLVSEYEDGFFYQRPSPEHPSGYYLQGRQEIRLVATRRIQVQQ